MKKALQLTLCVILACMFSGCGGGGGNSNSPQSATSTTASNPGTTSETPTTATTPTTPATTPSSAVMTLGGPIETATAGSNTAFFVTSHPSAVASQTDYYLAKVASSSTDWEKLLIAGTSGFFADPATAPVYGNGFIFFLGTKTNTNGNQVFLEKVDAVTGERTEVHLFDNRWPYKRGLAFDNTSGFLYFPYGIVGGGQFLAAIDQNGNQIYTVPKQSDQEEFLSLLPTPDAVYGVGRIMSGGGHDRFWVVKFSKDLQTRTWTRQFRPTDTNNNDLDLIGQAVVSPTGTIVLSGVLDKFATISGTGQTKGVIAEYDAAGTMRSWDISPKATQTGDLSVDNTGIYFTASNKVVKLNQATGTFVWETTTQGVRSLALVSDKLYVSAGSTAIVLDASTGK